MVLQNGPPHRLILGRKYRAYSLSVFAPQKLFRNLDVNQIVSDRLVGGVSLWFVSGEGGGVCGVPTHIIACSVLRSRSSMLVHTLQTCKYARTYLLSLCKSKALKSRCYPTLWLHAGKQSEWCFCESEYFYEHWQERAKHVPLIFRHISAGLQRSKTCGALHPLGHKLKQRWHTLGLIRGFKGGEGKHSIKPQCNKHFVVAVLLLNPFNLKKTFYLLRIFSSM